MEFKEILTFADNVFYEQKGKHLNDLQRNILQEALQGHKYAQIATENGCKVEYVREVASELWKALSANLGEKVTKSNVRVTLERAGFSIISSSIQNSFKDINNINFCGNAAHPLDTQKNQASDTPYVDLDDAPTPTIFYGRTQELDSLKTCILEQKNRLINIFGLTGIGKSTLTLKLVEQIKGNFDFVIWRSVSHFSIAETLESDLIEVFLQQEESVKARQQTKERQVKGKLRTLIQYLRQYRCLIILDDGQELFEKEKLAGEYQPQSQEYGTFFKQLGEVNHQSCIILNSWETPREIQILSEDKKLVTVLQLQGLGEAAKAILSENHLADEDTWEELINIYQGHPLWLKLIATAIQDLCSGKVSQCWQYQKILLTDDLKAILNLQIQRLAPLEKQILNYLSSSANPLTISEILPHLNDSPVNTFNAIKSLKKRCLIEQINNQEAQFTLTPVIKQYCLAQ